MDTRRNQLLKKRQHAKFLNSLPLVEVTGTISYNGFYRIFPSKLEYRANRKKDRAFRRRHKFDIHDPSVSVEVVDESRYDAESTLKWPHSGTWKTLAAEKGPVNKVNIALHAKMFQEMMTGEAVP